MPLETRIKDLATSLGGDIKTLTTALSGKRALKNQDTTNLTPGTDYLEKYSVVSDGTSTSTWINRVEYRTTPVGGGAGAAARLVHYLNEYFEWRGVARQNTVLWRAFVREFAADPAHDMTVPIWEIQNDRDARTMLHAMYGDGKFTHTGDGTVGGTLTVTGNVVAPNIGVEIKDILNQGQAATDGVGVYLRRP